MDAQAFTQAPCVSGAEEALGKWAGTASASEEPALRGQCPSASQAAAGREDLHPPRREV